MSGSFDRETYPRFDSLRGRIPMRVPIVWCGSFFVLGIVLAAPAPGWAQGLRPSKEALYKDWDKVTAQRTKLLAGEVQPGKADMDVAYVIARYFIHRFAIETEIPEKLHKEFDGMVKGAFDRKENRKFIEEFLAKALVDSMKEVLDRDVESDRATWIQAAVALPTMAKLTSKVKSDPIGMYLVELVKDKKTHDVVRLY